MEYMELAELNSSDRIKGIKSQKARALFTHRSAHEMYVIPKDWNPLKMALVNISDNVLQVVSAGKHMKYPCFLRACPETPRHGVIESIKCDNEEDLISKFEYLSGVMKEHDPDGCMILMPFVDAAASCVMALSHPEVDADGLTVMIPDEETGMDKPKMFQGYNIMGVGHDGITAGHGFNLAFPLRVNEHSKDNMIMNSLSYAPTHHELEFVFTQLQDHRDRGVLDLPKMNHRLTQIRGAPSHTPVNPPPEGVDTIGMIPQGELIVKDFIVMSGLESVPWLEENITPEKCPDGFMVVEPSGSRLSHIYAHCRGVGVAYAITPSVTVGDRWVEASAGWVVMDNDNKFEPKPYAPYAYLDDFRRGLDDGNTYWRKQQGWFSTFFHQWVSLPLSKPQHVAYLAGMFCAWLPKAMLALGLGEMRHARGLKSNANAELFATMTACVGSNVWKKITNTPYLDSTRSHYYAAISHIKVDWGDTAKLLRFLDKHFKAGWSSSYDGVKWGESMQKGAEVCDALQAFTDNANEDTLANLVEVVNVAENAVHNGGHLFNKWLSKYAFDVGTEGFNPRRDMDSMSSVFQMAREFLDNDSRDTMEAASPPENNWSEILDFVLTKTPAYWRKNPIATSTKVHQSLREVMEILPVGWRHGERGSHNSPMSKDFIMCGVASCSMCAKHIEWATENPTALTQSQLIKMKSLFDDYNANLMIAPPPVDVWLVGSQQETRASVKEQIALVKAKEFFPTAQEFIQLYEAIDPSDPDTPEMTAVLSKYLAKQDNIEDYLKQIKGDEKDEQ